MEKAFIQEKYCEDVERAIEIAYSENRDSEESKKELRSIITHPIILIDIVKGLARKIYKQFPESEQDEDAMWACEQLAQHYLHEFVLMFFTREFWLEQIDIALGRNK